MNVYKSLYKKVNEEKSMLEDQNDNLRKAIEKYDKQIKGSVGSLDTLQKSLQSARDDLQKIKVENNELRRKNDLLENRVDELYAQVNTMV